jgi:hypothetical protein
VAAHGLRRRLDADAALRLKAELARIVMDYPLGHATWLGLVLNFHDD